MSAVAVRVDHDGAVPDAFATSRLDAVVLTPAHQALLGATLAPARRTEFVRLAEGRGAYILEDDYDGEFRYDGHPIGALQGLAPERVIYAGTVSKSLAPRLRLGWLVVPEALLEPIVEAKRRADRGTDVLSQLALAELVSSGDFDRHIRRMRLRYRRRRDALVDTLRTAAPERRSVGLVGLERFWHGNPRARGVVLGYGTPHEHDYPNALAQLGGLLSSFGAGDAPVRSPNRAASRSP